MGTILLKLDDDTHEALRRAAKDSGRPQQRILREALDRQLDRAVAVKGLPRWLGPLYRLLGAGYEDAVVTVLERLLEKYKL